MTEQELFLEFRNTVFIMFFGILLVSNLFVFLWYFFSKKDKTIDDDNGAKNRPYHESKYGKIPYRHYEED